MHPLFLNAAFEARLEQLRQAGAYSPRLRLLQAAGSPTGRLQAAAGRTLVGIGNRLLTQAARPR